MVPPARSTPRRKPPSPFVYLAQAQPTMMMEMRTGRTQMRIRPIYRFMVGLQAFRWRHSSPALKPGAARRDAHAPPSLVVTAVEAGAAAGFASFAPLAAFASLTASSFVRLRKMLFLI